MLYSQPFPFALFLLSLLATGLIACLVMLGRTLSRYQEAIIRWVRGSSTWARRGASLVVRALAGSGKSFTLECIARTCIGFRIQGGARQGQPHSVLCFAFNVPIVRALRERLPQGVQAMTINGAGHRVLSRHFGKGSKINVDTAKYTRLCRDAVWSFGETLGAYVAVAESEDVDAAAADKQTQRRVRALAYACKRIIDMARVNLCRLDQLPTDRAKDAIEDLIQRYRIEVPRPEEHARCSDFECMLEALAVLTRAALLAGENAARNEYLIDYNDQLWLPHVWDLRGWGPDWVLVDEAQDLSPAQLGIVLRHRYVGRDRRAWTRLVFVGDPWQSIYGFAGADTQSIQRIIARTRSAELPLSVCYRCCKAVIGLVQDEFPEIGIEAAPGAIDGEVAECFEPDWLEVFEPRGGDLLLCRRTAPLVGHLYELWQRGISARLRGKKHGQELVRLLDWICDQYNGAAETLEGFLSAVRDWGFARTSALEVDGHDADSDAIEEVNDQVDALAGLSRCLAPNTVDELREGILGLCVDDPTEDEEHSTVWLSSIHRAKGLEANRVGIFEANRIEIPTDDLEQAQQERNLRYVAYTRAKERLVLIKDPPRNR